MAGARPAERLPAIVLLPGTLCDARLFEGQIRPLGALADRLIVGDLTRGRTVTEMAGQVLQSAPQRFALVGFSLGGIVALEMARLARARLTHLALICTTPRPDTPDRRLARMKQVEAAQTGGFRRIVTDELKPRYFALGAPRIERLKRLVVRMALNLGEDVFRRQSLALASRRDARPTLPGLAGLPTLALAGDDDALCPVAVHEEIVEAVPGAWLSVLPGCGHMAPLERPDEVSRELARFLTSA